MKLADWFTSIPMPERSAAIDRVTAACGVTRGAVRHWANGTRTPPVDRCPAIEAATSGTVRCDDLRPDVHWQRDDAGAVTSYVVPVPAQPPTSTQPQAA